MASSQTRISVFNNKDNSVFLSAVLIPLTELAIISNFYNFFEKLSDDSQCRISISFKIANDDRAIQINAFQGRFAKDHFK